jgi:hypothetical protein
VRVTSAGAGEQPDRHYTLSASSDAENTIFKSPAPLAARRVTQEVNTFKTFRRLRNFYLVALELFQVCGAQIF